MPPKKKNAKGGNKGRRNDDSDIEIAFDEAPQPLPAEQPAEEPAADDSVKFNADEEGNDLGGLMAALASSASRKKGGKKPKKNRAIDSDEDAAEILAKLDAMNIEEEPEEDIAPAKKNKKNQKKGKAAAAAADFSLLDDGDDAGEPLDDEEPMVDAAPVKKNKQKKGKAKAAAADFAALEDLDADVDDLADQPDEESQPIPAAAPAPAQKGGKKGKKGKKSAEEDDEVARIMAELEGRAPEPAAADAVADEAPVSSPAPAPAAQKGGKKGKKGKKQNADEDDEVARIMAELEGNAPPAQQETPVPAPAPAAAAAPAPAPAPVAAADAEDDEQETGEVRLKSKKEKERERKERQKQNKKATTGTSAAAPTPAPIAESAAPTEQAEDEDDDDQETGGDKDKKKKKKKKAAAAKKEEEPPATAKGPKRNNALLTLLRQQQAQREAQEAEQRRQEEEEARRVEEERRRVEEEERKKEEARLRKKEKEKQKKDELRKSGKYLTPSQKAAQQQQQRRLQQMIDNQGIVVPALAKNEGEEIAKPKRVVYGKKKKTSTKTAEADSGSSTPVQKAAEIEETKKEDEFEDEEARRIAAIVAAATPSVVAASPVPKASQAVKEDWEDSDDDVKDDWEQESEDEKPAKVEKSVAPAKTEPKPAAPVSAAKSSAKKPVEEDEEDEDEEDEEEDEDDEDEDEDDEDEDDDDDEDEDDDDDDDSDDDDEDDYSDDEMTVAEKQAWERKMKAQSDRQARVAAAMAARSKDNLRSPIGCILGHVDTGKTKLLDKIRQTNVQEGEAGGITQQIGATYMPAEAIAKKTALLKNHVEYKIPGLLIIDTPGHESFSNLRSRGSSLCNIAVLVVDIMHGLEPQTIESLGLLRDRKTPFIVALNKIDRLFGWKALPDHPVEESLAQQPDFVIKEYNDRVQKTILAFAEQGLNACLYYENRNFAKYVSLVPTSAHTGEGIPDLINLLVDLTQTRMTERLMYISELECTVLEVKVIEGHGTTIDVILSNGVLNEGDRICVCGLDGPIITQVRALLTPQPMRELRVKSAYVHHASVKAAQGIKISAPGLDKAIAGSRLMVIGPDDDEDDIKDEVMQDLTSLLSAIDKSGKGVCVQASTLGSLEALLAFLKTSNIPVSGINIGPVYKKDVIRASIMLDRAREYAQLLAFDVPIDKDAQQLADECGVKIFKANIIYHLFDQFTAYMKELEEQKRRDEAPKAIFPCLLKIVPGAIFNKRDPIILGVDVVEGILKIGTPLAVVEPEKKTVINIGKVVGIEMNRKPRDVVKRGEPSVSIRVESPGYDTPKMFGRHFNEQNELYSHINRGSIDILKTTFRNDLSKDDWALVVKLKKHLNIQ
ncbi:uncharacterized protein BJ171DRAFT_488235 [Polychytrium aggregatum]|uniref:uncharacterized protein n=1 Tax=Polychytrium aggregatum TaxID=110093 RepID=UPI0022FEFFFE|nr:uncharacterized protein BJ171DRAFT_488235 [Polychytrium aggregatum]KAI9209018.1 hypothetical protein BJ171DRAFT_488235 [Polychytrium aggregatum]